MARSIHRIPSLNALRVFEVVSRRLNFRIAAEELGVTQGAVAQQIRGLEAELGMKLFERQPRTLALTDAARSYATSLRRAFELISEATDMLRPEPLHVTISVTPTFASKWLIPRLQDFTAENPEVDLRVVASERISNFQTDAVDMAVRLGHPPFGSAVIAERLFENEIVAIGSRFLVEKLGDPEIADNLSRYPLLHDSHNLWPQFLERVSPGTPAHSEKNIRFNQTSLAIDAAVAGQGLALASAFFVEEDIAAGRLVRVFRTSLRVSSDFYLLTPRRPQQAKPIVAVRNWLFHASANPVPPPGRD